MRSRNGASGSRIGVKAKSAPSVAGVHLSIMMPLGTSMKAMRTGRAVAVAKAGVMASSTGKASAAPVPRRKARRGIDFLEISIACPPHLKRRAVDDAENDRRPALVVGGGLMGALAHDRTVVLLETAAERVGQEPVRAGLHELLAPAQQDVAQAGRSVELGAVGQD